jgi:cysteine rich repeat protein
MKMIALMLSIGVGLAAGAVLADEPTAPPAASQKTLEELRVACRTDVEKLCPAVQPGGGRIIACLKQHKDEVSAGCKQAIVKARQNPS